MLKPLSQSPVASRDSFDIRPDYARGILISDLLANDTDPDGDPLTLVAVGGNENVFMDVEGGYVIFFAPPASGKSTFTYTVANPEGLTSTADVEVTYGLFPLEPFSLTLAEDTRIIVGTVNFSGLGGATAFDQPAHGNVVYELINGGPGANIVYIPNRDYNGTDSFTLTYTTGSQPSQTREVNLTITPVDEPRPGIYLRATAGADVIRLPASEERLMIAGLGGDDTLYGGAGKDALNGGDDKDTLSGEGSNDLLTGGRGADRMVGGEGADTFYFDYGDLEQGDAIDRIEDFAGSGAVGGDILRFSNFGPGARIELDSTTTVSHIYQVYDAANGLAGRLEISALGTSGAVLTKGDYVFV